MLALSIADHVVRAPHILSIVLSWYHEFIRAFLVCMPIVFIAYNGSWAMIWMFLDGLGSMVAVHEVA